MVVIPCIPLLLVIDGNRIYRLWIHIPKQNEGTTGPDNGTYILHKGVSMLTFETRVRVDPGITIY